MPRAPHASPISHFARLRRWGVVGIVGLSCLAAPGGASAAETARRIVSLNPSLTAILVALGAREALVGVDDFSARVEPRVAELPRVGGLYSPSLEAVVALQPDRVVLVPSMEQRDFRDRLEALGIPVSVFENVSFDQVMENIERLGALVGRSAEATARIAEVRSTWRQVAALAADYPKPRTLVVLQRDPLFVIGHGSFIDEMLRVLGAVNAAAGFPDPYPRVAVEWVLGAAPGVIVDLAPDADAAGFWSRWPALPAVAAGRVVELEPGLISLPGPDLDRALEALATAVHGEAFGATLAERRQREGSGPGR